MGQAQQGLGVGRGTPGGGDIREGTQAEGSPWRRRLGTRLCFLTPSCRSGCRWGPSELSSLSFKWGPGGAAGGGPGGGGLIARLHPAALRRENRLVIVWGRGRPSLKPSNCWRCEHRGF